MVMDDRDRTILGALRRDGRISFRDLAEIANLSPNATAERVHRLQDMGVIRGFTVLVAPDALGLKMQAFIDVKLDQGTSMLAFEKALRKIENVREATVLTGPWDTRLRVDCADPPHLGRLIEELRTITGVHETSSTVICNELQLTEYDR